MNRRWSFKPAMMLIIGFVAVIQVVVADTAYQIDRDVEFALDKLYAKNPVAEHLSKAARGILVFPRIIKAGLVLGGHYGVGSLRRRGKRPEYYSTAAASIGFEAGAQVFGYALFFMTDASLRYLERSQGWELGVGPTIVVIDKGATTALTTSTAKEDIYAFFFNQGGLMAGFSVNGSKISRIIPDSEPYK